MTKSKLFPWLKPFGPEQVAEIRKAVPAGVDERLLRFIARSVRTTRAVEPHRS